MGFLDGVDGVAGLEDVLPLVGVGRALCDCFADQGTGVLGQPEKVCESRLCYLTIFICLIIGETCAEFPVLPGVFAPSPPVLPPSTQSADLFLADLTGSVAPTIPADIVEREGLTYYVLIRLLYNLGYGPCFGVAALAEPPIPGWSTVNVLNLIETPEQEDGGLREVPFIQVVERDDGSELLILVRATGTFTEARLLTYEDQVAFDDIIGETAGTSASEPMIREGLGEILRAVYPSLRRIVDESTAERVIVAGYSLGASVASYIALGLATTFPDDRVDLVAFAPPRAFDQAFADLMVETLNLRNPLYEFDFIARSACNTAVGCSAADASKTELQLVEYVDFPAGRIDISEEDLGEPNGISPLSVWAPHTCSYLCWTVRNFQPDDPVDWCEAAPSDGQGDGAISLGSICPYSLQRLPLL
ncbi:unnamed protein product [Vitrella brassicaformis CCMP3155]|uniref:Fungal lipase-type domain-containing protein n=1 Tax=Vitrella brassicaformis (strain CCMP3155) TaxID=1169540 RepID=A0A0G4FV21_VITBC|nr:unnamed protein product [Vitrella brassicaformis CCMP3155]|eukprot:CEM18813.1 unnamed protein product [Vitrella brassicaformis CCMP3155]